MIDKKGKFIVIEGTDCSGKETQTKKLIERLNKENISCSLITFPQYWTATGDIVGDCYLGKGGRVRAGSWFGIANNVDPKIASLYYAADRYSASTKIKKMLEQGVNVICDRYVESNMGHQGEKIRDPEKRKEFIDWLEKLEYGLLELPKPDDVIFLYMPFEVGIELKKGRKGIAEGHESSREHLENAEKAYLELANKYKWFKIDCILNKTQGSLKSIKEIHEEVWQRVYEHF